MESSGVALGERPQVAVALESPERSSAPRAPSVPRPLLVVSAGVVAAGTAMAVAGAWRTGLSWDEPFHVMRLRNYLDSGWFALDWSVDTAGSAGASAGGDDNTLVYAPVTMLLLHALGVLTGTETWGTVATTPDAYQVRHLGVVVIGLVGTAAAAATTRVLLGSWRWALVTAAALLALPMWTGHLMFNIKDVPVATGYTLATLALVAMVPPASGTRVLRVLTLTAGLVLMVGTRPGMATAAVLGLTALVAGLLTTARPARRPLAEAVAGTVLAAVVLVAVYPRLFAQPWLLAGSAEQSSRFRGGESADVLYIPFYLVAQFPLLLQLAAVVGVGFAVRTVRRRAGDPVLAVRTTLVVTQVAALPLLAVVRGSDLYNGLRQLLFITPAWAVLVALGAAVLVRRVRERGLRPGRQRLAGVVAVAALLLPVVDQATLFPYGYTYYNAALDATMADVQSDYWRTSIPELLPAVPRDGQVVCGPTRASADGATDGSPEADGLDDTDLLAGRYSGDSSVDCRTDQLGPLASRWLADGLPLTDGLPHEEFYVVVDRDHGTPANCTRLAQVDRRRHWRTVSMSYVARCRLDPAPLEGTVAFTRLPGDNMAPATWAYAPDGWTGYASLSAIDAAYADASLTFAVPDGCRPCRLVLDADAPADLTATVDDRSVEVGVSPGSVEVRLPADASEVWLTFTRSSGEPLGLRVRSIRLAPAGTAQEEVR